MPVPPDNSKKAVRGGKGGAAAAAAYWDIVGETYLPPHSEVPSLKERAAWVAAECIDRAPEVRDAVNGHRDAVISIITTEVTRQDHGERLPCSRSLGVKTRSG